MREAEIKNEMNQEMADIIVNESNHLCYLSDVDTYEIYFANRELLRILKVSSLSEIIGKKCYEVFHGHKQPCSFCTNHCIQKDAFYVWERYDAQDHTYYEIKDKLINLNGRDVRLEIATNVTEKELEYQNLKHRLNNEEMLVRCIHTLSDMNSADEAVNNLLGIIGEYYGGERSYIFEFDFAHDCLNNTYEWCRSDITPQIEKLQNVPSQVIARWMEQFEKSGEFFLSSLHKTVDPESSEYQILHEQNIESLVAASMEKDQIICGFIGVDNPSKNETDLTLLKSITYFIMNDIEKKRMLSELEHMSYTDMLTGAFNRNRYNIVLQEIEYHPPRSIGILYSDINGLKLMNDTRGHSYGDRMICATSHLLQRIFPQQVYRIGGDEFIILALDMAKTDFNQKAEELQTLVEENPLIQLSIGLAWESDVQDIKKLIAVADKFMYQKKQEYYQQEEIRQMEHQYYASSDNISKEANKDEA